jgi:hypothetical protein
MSTLYKNIHKVINEENDRIVSKATTFLRNQPFALNANGIVIIENVKCYRTDSVGFWFTYNYVNNPTKQVYCVYWNDIEEVGD